MGHTRMQAHVEPYMKRSIRMPLRVDSALKTRAMMSGRSVTQEMVSALERGLGLVESDPVSVELPSSASMGVGEFAPFFDPMEFVEDAPTRNWPCEHRVPAGQHCPHCDGRIPY